jgi:hypothetical protein
MTGPTRRRDEPGAEPGVNPWVRHFAAMDSFQAQGSSRRNVRGSSRSAEVRMKVRAAVYRHVTT